MTGVRGGSGLQGGRVSESEVWVGRGEEGGSGAESERERGEGVERHSDEAVRGLDRATLGGQSETGHLTSLKATVWVC